MRGIELSRNYFNGVCRPVLLERFPDIAAGLAGHGSECFGFDDEISRDHDYSVGVAFFLTDEEEARSGYALTRAYRQLLHDTPPPDCGTKESALGMAEHGVIRISDFFRRHLGFPGIPETWRQWLYTPEYAFAEALNGEIFYDGPGVFSALRQNISSGMPEDVLLKKLAARTAAMAQSGQYNFNRCLKHGEPGGAQFALDEFCRNTASAVYLLNGRFAPYYKWLLRGLRSLPKFGDLADPLEFLLTSGEDSSLKSELVELICAQVAAELRQRGFSDCNDSYLEPHAFALMRRIRSREIRALHVMEG